MATFDPMKARTPGSQTAVTGPTRGRDPQSALTSSQITASRRPRQVEYKYLPSGARTTPRYSRFYNRYVDKSIYNYFSNRKNFPNGLSPDMITPAISRIIRDETGKTLPYRIPDSERYLGNFDMFAFAKPGVPGAQARLADVRTFVDTKGAAFGLRQGDAQKMIEKGLMAYATTMGSDHKRIITVANPVALQNFLSTNYKAKKGKPKFDAGGMRVDKDQVDYVKRKPNYTFDDRFEYYQELYGLNPRSTAFLYDPQREKNIKRVETKTKEPYIEKSKDPNKADKVKTRTLTSVDYEFDFEAMANDYKDYREADAKWREKILDKIEDEGGTRGLALWNKYLNGNANNEEISELKGYMYSFSPQGTYADVQKTFMAEVTGTDFAEVARTAVETERQKERAAAAKKRRMEEQAEQAFVREETRLEFFTGVTDQQSYANARALIMEGRGADIPIDVLQKLKMDLNATTNGRTGTTTRASEALGLEGTVAGNLADVLTAGQTAGAEANKALEDVRSAEYQRDSQKVDFINMVNTAIANGTNVGPEVVALANEFMNDLGNERYSQIVGNSQEFQAFQQDAGAYALGKLAEVGNAGSLSPTSADTIRNNMSTWQATNAVKENLAKSIVRTSLSIPYGLYSLATDPLDAMDAIVADYERRYSSVDGFVDSTLEDPLAPILDLISLVPVAGLAAKSAQIAKVAAMTTKAGRAGLSARQFAKMQRQVMTGSSPNAEAVMKILMSKGEFGELNQLYSAGRIDAAATFFEPRYVVLNAAEGIPDTEVSGVVKALAERHAAEAKDQVYVRMAGNPVSRGFQNLTLGFQKSTGKMGINLPLIGFQYRYGKALREGNPFVSDMVSRELMVERQLQELQNADLDDAEQMAAWYAAGGNGQGYAAFMAVINRRLDEAQALGESFGLKRRAGEGEIRMLEVDYDRYLNAEFERRYRDAVASMIDVDEQGIPRTERGRRIAKMRDAMMLLSERNNRVLKGEADPRTLAAFQRTYALVLTASRLLPEDTFAELGPKGAGVIAKGRMPIVNPNIRIPELLNADARQLTNGDNNFVDDTDAAVRDFLDSVNDGFARLKRDMATRDAGGNPVLFLDDTVEPIDVPTTAGRRVEDVTLTGERVTEPIAGPTMRFYPMRYLRIEGNFDDADMSFERKGLLSDEIVWIPEWALAKSRTGNVKFKSVGQGRVDVETAVVNKMNKLFPNARDFVDKISDRSVRGPESFANRQNRNEVIASGLSSYQFDVQLAASVRATRRKVAAMFEETIDQATVPITVREYQQNPDAWVPLTNGRIFDNKAAAEAYASTRKQGDLESQETGTIEEFNVGDKTYYRVKMNFFDAMSTTLAEQRLQRMADWESEIAKFFIDDEMVKRLSAEELAGLSSDEVAARYQQLGLSDPDAFMLVIPRTVERKLTETARRSNNTIMQVLYGASDLFKTFVLAMSPKFISQQVTGSSVMLMIARPEWAPYVMSQLIAKGASNAAKEMTGKGRKVRRENREAMVDLAQLGDDFMILQEIFADDFGGSNIFLEDMATRGQRFDQLVNFAEKKSSRTARFMRPLLNNKPARIGGKVAKTVTSFGYIIAFAFESAMRAQIMKRAALGNPVFKAFMDSDVVTDFMQQPVPQRLIGKQTRFHAALRLVADPNSPYYDPFILREMRYQADSIVGNYRWFTPTEKAARDFLLPFYAWTRHSAIFTKRMVQDRPITANFMYNMGNYGYEEMLEAGGLPDWMLESIPLAGDAANILGLDPGRANFLMTGSVNPFGQPARTFAQIQGLLPGVRTDLGDMNNPLQGMNPYLVGGVAKELGVDPLTGIPLTEEEKNKSLGQYYFDMYSAFPVIAQTVNLFKTETDLNEARGMDSPDDIFVNPDDPTSKLRAVPERLSMRSPTTSPSGLFNVFSPSRVMSLEPTMLDEMTKEQWKTSGVIVEEQKKAFKSQRTKAAESLREWRRLRDFVMTYWMPRFGNDNPELAQRVMVALREQYPGERTMSGLSQAQIDQILGETTNFGG